MATEYGSRLRTARKLRGLTQIDLSKATGIPQSTISTAEREGTKSLETTTYATVLKVRPEWLAAGDGPMEPTTTSLLSQSLIRNESKLSTGITEIPLLTRKTAGMFTDYTTGAATPPETHPYHGPVGQTFAYRVDDDTMQPDFRVGTLAIIECDTPPQHGDVVLIEDNTGAYLRKLVVDGDYRYVETISGRLPARPLTATIVGWVSGEFHPRRSR